MALGQCGPSQAMSLEGEAGPDHRGLLCYPKELSFTQKQKSKKIFFFFCAVNQEKGDGAWAEAERWQ